MIKSRCMRWAGCVAHVADTYNILKEELQRRNHRYDRHRYKPEDKL
jgi:hypothetical protein